MNDIEQNLKIKKDFFLKRFLRLRSSSKRLFDFSNNLEPSQQEKIILDVFTKFQDLANKTGIMIQCDGYFWGCNPNISNCWVTHIWDDVKKFRYSFKEVING